MERVRTWTTHGVRSCTQDKSRRKAGQGPKPQPRHRRGFDPKCRDAASLPALGASALRSIPRPLAEGARVGVLGCGFGFLRMLKVYCGGSWDRASGFSGRKFGGKVQKALDQMDTTCDHTFRQHEMLLQQPLPRAPGKSFDALTTHEEESEQLPLVATTDVFGNTTVAQITILREPQRYSDTGSIGTISVSLSLGILTLPL